MLSKILEVNILEAYVVKGETPERHCKCCYKISLNIQFSRSVMSDSLRPHGLQQARSPCPLPTPRVYSNSRPLSR